MTKSGAGRPLSGADLGGLIAAIGLTGVLWGVGVTRSLASGHVPPALFIAALPVALLGWAVLRWWSPPSAIWATARTALLVSALFLPGCAVHGNAGYSKSRAYLTTLKSDLRQLTRAEEAFLDSAGTYTASLEQLGFTQSLGASAPVITSRPRAWTATNTHERLPLTTCGIGVNATNPVDPATGAGEIACAPLVLPMDAARHPTR